MLVQPNQIIDSRYKVLTSLGQGGMGVVWKAIDQQLGDEVVIKMPLSNSDPALLKRFGTEAQMMRKHSVENPYILDIHGTGNVDGTPYYVMRFLPGGSLEDRCPLVDSSGNAEFKEETFEWLINISKALDYLHENGVIHRDVKPANILFNKSGDAYLADFGIAKNPTEVTSYTQAATATGTSPGTFAYMAPEVLNPEPNMPATGGVDQYALAVTLHEAISGSRPYDATNVIKLYHQTQQGCQPLRESFPMLPEPASQAVVRALSADSAERFADCRSFAKAFLNGLRKEKISIVDTPQVHQPSDEGTRELDLQEYRKKLQQEQPVEIPINQFAKAPDSTKDKIRPENSIPKNLNPQVNAPVRPSTQEVPSGTSGKGIASLILGLLSIFGACFTAVPGLILGIMGLRDFAKGRSKGRGIAIAGIIFSGLGILYSIILAIFLVPAVEQVRTAARQTQSTNNMRELVLGCLNYESAHREFPLRQRNGLSWRVHILPHAGHGHLYNRFNLDEAWDSPHNLQLLDEMPDLFKCPSVETPPGFTIYQVPYSDAENPRNAVAMFHESRATTFGTISDGSSNTIMLLEVNSEAAVEWTKPDDWKFDPNNPLRDLGGVNPGFILALFADGSSDQIPTDVSPENFRALLTRSGGDISNRNW